MKLTLRKTAQGFEAYVPKKDLEAMVTASETPTLWGGWIELSNGWRFQMPETPPKAEMPMTFEARKIGGD